MCENGVKNPDSGSVVKTNKAKKILVLFFFLRVTVGVSQTVIATNQDMIRSKGTLLVTLGEIFVIIG